MSMEYTSIDAYLYRKNCCGVFINIDSINGLDESLYRNFRGEFECSVEGFNLNAVIGGYWTDDELLFILENKVNAISPRGLLSTSVFCPNKRKDELLQILKKKFGKLTFGETDSKQTYIAVDGMRHCLFLEDESGYIMSKEGGHRFVMHLK